MSFIEPIANQIVDLRFVQSPILKLRWTDEISQHYQVLSYIFILSTYNEETFEIDQVKTMISQNSNDGDDEHIRFHPEILDRDRWGNPIMELELEIDPYCAADGDYFLRIIKEISIGHIINYSPPFRLRGMHGEVAGFQNTGLEQFIPGAITIVDEPVIPNPIPSEYFSIPYNSQTGPIRYAPMQMQPKTSAELRRKWSNKYKPTPITTFYRTNKPNLVVYTTITPGVSYSIKSDVNWATPAPMPYRQGSWYAPAQKLTQRPRKVNFPKTF